MAGEFVVAASAARSASVAAGDAVPVWIGVNWKRLLAVLDVTVLASIAGDKADVFLDLSPDKSKWINVVHFTQLAGNGSAKTEAAMLDTTTPGTAVIDTTSDLAAAVVRPTMVGKWARMRLTITNGGGTHIFTYSLKVYT